MYLDLKLFGFIYISYLRHFIIIFAIPFVSFQNPDFEKLSPYECGLILSGTHELNLNYDFII
jgi:NADH:ubiquinone oxidoreductase subunit 3 (subunit A)